MDEARIGQKGRACHRWYEKGERPPGLVDRRLAPAWPYAAVRPGSGEDITLVLPGVPAAATGVFLNHFGESLRPGDHALLALGQAGWHGARALEVPASITLVPLPSCSPRLNPAERVRDYLRERFPSPRLHSDHDAVVAAACRACNRLTAETGRLLPLCACPRIQQLAS